MSDFTIEGFANHLGTLALEVVREMDEAMAQCAQVVHTRAIEKFGEYQDEVEQFAAWAPLLEATQDQRARQGYTPDSPLLRRGDLQRSVGREHTVDTMTVGSTSEIMVYQELGTSHIPPRAVLGPAMIESLQQIEAIIGRRTIRGLLYGSVGAMSQL